MHTVEVTLKSVVIPGVTLPVSGKVNFLPASWSYQHGPEDAEIIDSSLQQEDGASLPILTQEGYFALLGAATAAYESLVAEAYGDQPDSPAQDAELPF